MKNLFLAAACLALAACDTPIGTEVLRAQAKDVVNGEMSKLAPGTDVSPITDCVIDNASGSEIVDLAGAAVDGVTSRTSALVLEIATRPETVECYKDNVAPLIVAGIIFGTL